LTVSSRCEEKPRPFSNPFSDNQGLFQLPDDAAANAGLVWFCWEGCEQSDPKMCMERSP